MVPAVDAPNVNGARDVRSGAGERRSAAAADLPALVRRSKPGSVSALYVFDPGPEGSLGDDRLDYRRAAKRQAAAADRPGRPADRSGARGGFRAAGRIVGGEGSVLHQRPGTAAGTARAIPLPGEAMEDWRILVNLATALGVSLDYTSAAHVRADIAARYAGATGLDGDAALAFAQPVRRARGCRRRTRRSAGNGISCIRICRR